MDEVRINKYLSQCGLCSRREADKYIESGNVTINGKVAVLGDRVSESDDVRYKGKKLLVEKEFVLLAYNKPIGVECTADKKNPDNIIDKIGYNKKIFYVGRLDKNSCGLILFTNDGDLGNRIAKAVNEHEKEYVVKIKNQITDEFINKMSKPVHILDTVTRPCKVWKIDNHTFGIILTQGLNRQIRRMTEASGEQVTFLKRIRVMNIKLDNLGIGKYRECTQKEIDELKQKVYK